MNSNKSKMFLGLVLMLGLFVLSGCWHKKVINTNDAVKDSDKTTEKNVNGAIINKNEDSMKKDLQTIDITVGSGAEAKNGSKIQVHYNGTLENGTKFDSSYDRGLPFEFVLGSGSVIKGWDLGVLGMKVGGKRKLVIPADLAYGAQSPSPLIPANATLIFEVELLEVDGKGQE